MLIGVDHTAIASQNPLRLAEWYEEKLGFKIVAENDGKYFIQAPNRTLLELIPGEGMLSLPQMKDTGVRHIALLVDDLAQSRDELRGKGIDFITDVIAVEPLRLRVIFFRDLDGNILHLIQRVSATPW
jgi:glyoxylase I family protein